MTSTSVHQTEIVSDPHVPLVRYVLASDGNEGRDAFVASGMADGVREGYERLDALLGS